MIELPKTKTKPGIVEPKKLVIFSHPKIGKTSLVASLPNSLIIDLEDGSEYYECASINVKKLALEQGKTLLEILSEVKTSLVEAKSKGVSYDFIILDTTTVLEQIARDLALSLYKNTNIGKGFKGTDVVSELPNGAGYEWLRLAFDKIYKGFTTIPNKCLILLGHVKSASISKDGKDLQAKDIQLTGKLKLIVNSDADGTGFLRRDKESNKNILSFKTSETDLITGTRIPYLSGKEIVISEIKDNNILETHWEEIFPSLKK